MNREANSMRWKLGDYAIHDTDAKNGRMLAVVTGCANDGMCIMRYADKRFARSDTRTRSGCCTIHYALA